MITLDSRIGSKDLLPYFTKREAALGKLEYGDASWIGNGPGGVPLLIGAEIKWLHDLLSSMTSGRFAGHQLPGLQASYDVYYLIPAGAWRGNPRTGMLEVPRGKKWEEITHGTRRFMKREVDGWLNTQAVIGRCILPPKTPGTPRELAGLIRNLYQWWTDKTYEEHRSHLAFDESASEVLLTKPSIERRAAALLPGIGWGKSQVVEERFGSIREMANSEVEDWLDLEGVGETVAGNAVKALRGEK